MSDISNNYIEETVIEYNNIIGEGSYGYVFNPPLDFDYDEFNLKKDKNYITKLTTKDDATAEINNQELILSIDKFYEYNLGKYYMTKLNTKQININRLKIFNKNDINNLYFIIQENGGYDLSKVCKLNKIKNYDECKKLIIEFYRMLNGIKILNENNIIHHDIKPSNIVYDKNNNRLNFIDYNLTIKKSDIISQATKSEYDLSLFHASFPIELGFYNKNEYELFKTYDDKKITQIWNKITKKILNNIKSDNELIKSIDKLFNNYYLLDKINENSIKGRILQNLKNFLFEIKSNDYTVFMQKSLETFDLYGYGIVLMYISRHYSYLIPPDILEELYELSLKILDLNVFTRISITETNEIFTEILKTYELI
jgi:serine/threonine protein kinase